MGGSLIVRHVRVILTHTYPHEACVTSINRTRIIGTELQSEPNLALFVVPSPLRAVHDWRRVPFREILNNFTIDVILIMTLLRVGLDHEVKMLSLGYSNRL